MEQDEPLTEEQEFKLHQQVVQKILELMTAAFSLVAALAWNDAIQALFTKIIGPGKTITAKFLYALIVTAVVVWIAYRLSRIQKLLEKKSKPEKID